ncbi:acyl-CoA N-acyltransferase [Jimgerdemannia flammicorona]|nr:acyl-CoA N-acyltransferase [Jimgerdemannia flammicorona]
MPDTLSVGSPARRDRTRSVSPAVSGAGTPLASSAISTPQAQTIQSVTPGCVVTVKRLPEPLQAEVLMTRVSPDDPTQLEYYVHYVSYNKRLDSWVKVDQLDLTMEIVYPKTKKTKSGLGHGKESMDTPPPESPMKAAKGRKAKAAMAKNSTASPANPSTPNAAASPAPTTTPNKRKFVEEEAGDSSPMGPDQEGKELVKVEEDAESGEEDNMMLDGDESTEKSADPGPVSGFSKDKEIEKLRTSGSMTQCVNEISRIKNLNRIQIGKHEVETWYFSPYPPEYAHADTIYICEFCLSHYLSKKQLQRHRNKCQLQHPPGNEIYRHQDISFFEIDGRKQKTWCRNLCLLSKLFLDHKTLYYDVDPFLFYCMTLRDEVGCHLIGYFSKEKESSENYNVACILTLPQWQRMGFGKLLIAFSYELSRVEGKVGSPEKPLSDLGLLSYRAYWADTIVEMLLNTQEEITVEEISQKTAITTQDILHTLQFIGALRYYKGQHVIAISDKIQQDHEKHKRKTTRRIEPTKLSWQPIKFSQAQLRFL